MRQNDLAGKEDIAVKKRSNWSVITFLSLVPLLMVLGNSVLIPGMPEMQNEMHVTKFQVSLIITLFSVPAGIVIPFAGFLSDRYSRRWIVVPSLLLFGAGGIAAGLAGWFIPHPYTTILIARVVQGIGASGTAPIAMAWLGDLFSGSQRSQALGVNEAGNALGKVVSPVLGAAVFLISWYAAFFIFPILCIPLAAAVWWLIPEKKTSQSKQTVLNYIKSLGPVVKREGRWLSVAYLSGAAALFNLFGVLFYLSDLLENKYQIDGIRKGLVLAIPLLVLSVTSLVTGSLIKKRKKLMKWLMVSGFAILGAALLTAVWLTSNAWVLVALMSFGAIGTGVILPSLNTLITSAVSQEQRGMVTSWYGSVRFLGVAAGPPVYTWLLSFSSGVMFISVAVFAFVCGLLSLVLIHPKTQGSGSSEERSVPMKRSIGRHRARV